MGRWLVAAVLGGLAAGAAGVAGAAGCGGSSLTPDDQVRLLMTKNQKLEEDLLACERRVAELGGAAHPAAAHPATAHPAAAHPATAVPEDPYRAIAIRFSRFSGVVGGGARPEDERLKIILEPVDAEGEVVKRAGSLNLEAMECLSSASKDLPPALKAYHRWNFPMKDLAQTWIGTLGVRGYVLHLEWPEGRRPAAGALLMRAKFTTLTGEVLAAETTIAIPPPKAPEKK